MPHHLTKYTHPCPISSIEIETITPAKTNSFKNLNLTYLNKKSTKEEEKVIKRNSELYSLLLIFIYEN